MCPYLGTKCLALCPSQGVGSFGHTVCPGAGGHSVSGLSVFWPSALGVGGWVPGRPGRHSVSVVASVHLGHEPL